MPNEPLVLMAFSNPDANRPLRNLPREEREVRRALDVLVDDQKLDATQTLWNAAWGDVTEQLRKKRHRGRIRVFHYGGHADEATLMLTDEHGTPSAWNMAGFLDYLAQQEGLELVVLNGCSTDAQIERLRKTRIKAVVATTCAIRDELAADFTIELYKELVAGRPLKAAFEAAKATLRGSKGKAGDEPRAFVHDELVAHGEEITEWPWVLSCEPEDEGWMLVKETAVVVTNEQAEVDRDLVDRIARVLHDEDGARLAATRAGFPREGLPKFTNALKFWNAVLVEISEGMVEGGVQALIDEVARMYPGNEYFKARRSKR